MTLVYDLRTMRLLFHYPPDYHHRDRRVVSVAEAIRMIGMEELRRRPRPSKTFYQRHRVDEIARRKEYRATHREEIARYNRNYQMGLKRRRALVKGQTVLQADGIGCST